MNGNDFQKNVMRTANKELTKYESLTNASLGLAGETGEFIDMIKKFKYHGHELNNDKLEKELGDILYYVAYAADCLGLTFDQVMLTNVKKLQKRYPEGFSSANSLNRPEE